MMAGKIRRKLIVDSLTEQATLYVLHATLVCPICDREIPTAQRDAHHLIPKSKGGRKTHFLHRICHRQIHALLTETELATKYNSVDQLLSHPEIAKFVAWIKNKPGHFIERSYKSQRIRPK